MKDEAKGQRIVWGWVVDDRSIRLPLDYNGIRLAVDYRKTKECLTYYIIKETIYAAKAL